MKIQKILLTLTERHRIGCISGTGGHRMRTVKEVSELTGISVRTLHYYDEIGLFEPTVVSEAGYRLYDDKALERLQQILFFREFDMPLKEIKNIMENPDLDKNRMLQSQKQVLVLKKERLERIIASIDDILKGENKMDFEIFSKADIEQLYQMKDITGMMLEMADLYKNDRDFQTKNDGIYGAGSTQYIGEAIEVFYK